MKRDWLFGFILLCAINFVSSLGVNDLLSQIDESTVIFLAVFLIAFALIFFALNKVFKGNTSISGIISVALSFLIVYGINKSQFDVEGFFFDLGVPSSLFATIIPIIVVAGIIFLVIKFKKDSLYIIGGLFLVASLFVYAKTLMLTIGIILIGIRLFLWASDKGYLKNNPRAMSHAEAVKHYKNAGADV
jgi:hypothetical protein